MLVDKIDKNKYWLSFDNEEVTFLDNEAKDNKLSVEEMLLMLLGMLFIGGYSNIVRKE